ncbi:ImmA/IrrE family metallo-endopeptidase [Candidatus Spongiihabitans sp.]|uniref:ImmA/IrrE family metallo-endopeptidase n=1 Tax=Candidatus Spongiihabitans sp. TaxID=3101308 RepID=UPI003C7A4F72
MSSRVENINPEVLRQCREQAGFSHADVEKRIKFVADVEEGGRLLTFNQLDILAKLYHVPRWVFVSEVLPEKYQFDKTVPAFRQFTRDGVNIFNRSGVRILIAKIERLRDLILELREEMDERIEEFDPPGLSKSESPQIAARQVRQWLDEEGNLELLQWREKLEEKNIFVFMTSKYRGWSHMDKDAFRGLALYHPTLPIIVINDSDAKKAQSFTLFHELGHLLRGENAIDGWSNQNQRMEKWCEEFAGNVLMPADPFLSVIRDYDISDLSDIEPMAKRFKVSTYACLVRLRQLNIINQILYIKIETQIKRELARFQKILKGKTGGHARNMPTEALRQYGQIYTNALFQAYHNGEIGLHKLCKLFDFKQASHALQLEEKL